jgi:hypothetical protein
MFEGLHADPVVVVIAIGLILQLSSGQKFE